MSDQVSKVDGLPARETGPWVHDKYRLLDYYSEMVTASMRGKWPRGVMFVDIMSGPGVCVDTRTTGDPESPGSTLRALSTRYAFDRVIAIDSNPKYADAIRRRTAGHLRATTCECRHADCNAAETITFVRSRIDRALTLMFVDLLGTEVAMATLRALSANRSVDLVITWPEMDARRNIASMREQADRWTAFFGTEDWRAIMERPPLFQIRDLRELYRDQLKKFGYQSAYGSPIKNLKGGRLYRPLFASRDNLGMKFWRSASSPKVQQSAFDFLQ